MTDATGEARRRPWAWIVGSSVVVVGAALAFLAWSMASATTYCMAIGSPNGLVVDVDDELATDGNLVRACLDGVCVTQKQRRGPNSIWVQVTPTESRTGLATVRVTTEDDEVLVEDSAEVELIRDEPWGDDCGYAAQAMVRVTKSGITQD